MSSQINSIVLVSAAWCVNSDEAFLIISLYSRELNVMFGTNHNITDLGFNYLPVVAE